MAGGRFCQGDLQNFQQREARYEIRISEVLCVIQIPIKQGVRSCQDKHFSSRNLKKGDPGPEKRQALPDVDVVRNAADRVAGPRLHQFLRQPDPVRLPVGEFSKSISKSHLLRAAGRPERGQRTPKRRGKVRIDENDARHQRHNLSQ
ncbi:unnamed protein product, partial [Nesidiocoris tenuis]